ncbi:MAG: SAM-dependent methyltransferase [Chloroflexi bacterium RBG_16_56_11]|nr:MAG: SAM-dependent methyltransferase [Chloroflexi bacterium RBG_16_56_11]
MSLMFRFRDLVRPRLEILKEVGIEPGFSVLDFGCGPGGYISPLAGLIGPSGSIYALDVNPLAIKSVQSLARKKKLDNVTTIQADCATGLPDSSVDIALLYDVFHHLSQPRDVLAELYRILKKGGVISVSDHHLTEDKIISGITGTGLFRLVKKGQKVHNFSPLKE